MKPVSSSFIILCMACLIGCGCNETTAGSSNSPATAKTSDDFTHQQSGLIFPKKVGPFERVEIKDYDKSGYNISVGYNTTLMSDVQVAITFYIYPHKKTDAAALISGHFAELKNTMLEYHSGMKFEREQESETSIGGEILKGRQGLFSNYENFAYREQEILSELRLFVWKEWFLKYRITYPKDMKEKAQLLVGSFLNGFPKQNDTDHHDGSQKTVGK